MEMNAENHISNHNISINYWTEESIFQSRHSIPTISLKYSINPITDKKVSPASDLSSIIHSIFLLKNQC
jgi:hypothetical protein